MPDNSQHRAAKYRTLQEKYIKQLPSRFSSIDAIWQAIKQSNHDMPDALAELHRHIHGIAGSAGTFGFKQLGEQARELEILIRQIDDRALLAADVIQTIDEALTALQLTTAEGPDQAGPISLNENAKLKNSNISLVYVLEDDEIQAQEMVDQLSHFGYDAKAFDSANDIYEAYTTRVPAALIADIGLPEGDLEGPRIARELRALVQHDVPVIFVSGRNDWQARLASIRAGGLAYFSKPLDFTLLLEQLDRLMGRKEEKPYRVLIVDDMELLAQHYAEVLIAAGMTVEIVNEPARILETMSAFQPELILMDLYMPGCSGIEAAQIIRQHSNYQSIPIVYLSTEGALQEQLAALRVGGDDFLQKPISDEHLLAAVNIRAMRFRDLSALMSRDSLTGLLNHINLKLALERELAESMRLGGCVSFAMLDIDHFKSVNDNYGHPVGDRVIKSLSRLLSQRLRKSDIIGRYGGEEFAVILPGTEAQAAAELLDGLRETFHKINHSYEAGEFTSAFSVGIASTKVDSDLEGLIKAADEALYQAKKAGRNQVALAKLG